jgi:hypothetical protein
MLGLMLPGYLGIFVPDTSLEKITGLIPTAFLTKVMHLSLAGEATLARIWVDLALSLGVIALVYAAIVWVLRRQGR